MSLGTDLQVKPETASLFEAAGDKWSLQRRKAYLMKLKILALAALVLVVLSAPGWAIDATQDKVETHDCLSLINLNSVNVTGKWIAQLPGKQGTIETTFTFKADGEQVTGTVSNSEGDNPISKGRIAGDEISFVVAVRVEGNEIGLLYKGKASGEEIRFTRQRQSGGMSGSPGDEGAQAQEFIAKRVK